MPTDLSSDNTAVYTFFAAAQYRTDTIVIVIYFMNIKIYFAAQINAFASIKNIISLLFSPRIVILIICIMQISMTRTTTLNPTGARLINY